MTQMNNMLERRFTPGSNWLYCKIYMGSSLSDKILEKEINRVVLTTIHEHVDLFFFIRYSDPDYHLRLRFKLNSPDRVGNVVMTIHNTLKHLIVSGHIRKIQYDTYEREIERYGMETIEDSEHLFFNNSMACLELFKILNKTTIDNRVFVATKMIKSILDCFCFDSQVQVEVIDYLSTSFKKEFGIQKHSKQINRLYRQWRSELTHFMNGTSTDSLLLDCDSIINKMGSLDKPFICSIMKKVPLHRQIELVYSYVHMMMNRLFVSRQRMMELIVYECLYKYYKSENQKH